MLGGGQVSRFASALSRSLSRASRSTLRDADFNDIVPQRRMRPIGRNLQAEWQAYVATLDYGYDFERMAIDFQPRQAARRQAAQRSTIAADRGWQSSGVWLEAGKSYRVSGERPLPNRGRTTSDGAQTWPCEPGGVTIEYHDGRPLGMLLGAIVERRSGDGRGRHVVCQADRDWPRHARSSRRASGTLYLRVNDSAARLDDNRGTLDESTSRAD